MNTTVMRGMVAITLIAIAQAARADTCMVSPTDKEVVSGRFGKFRGGGAGNFGSANKKAHMHDGLDFSTSGSSQPVYATTEGKIVFAGLRGSAGNAVLIERANGDVVAYYHLSGFANGVKRGATVKPGQQLGLSGNTPSASMVKHLHFTYGTAAKDSARAKAFAENAHKGPFNAGQLAPVFNRQADIGWKTDPAPYFCQTYPIQDGHPEHYPILGKDTKAQHEILFGNVPSGGVQPDSTVEPVQVAAANADAALAQADGKVPATYLSDADGYGALPTPPIGGYDTMSVAEMLTTEATRRFSDAEWNTSITHVSSRALWVDYNRAVGVSNYLSEAIYRKKEKVEALLAVYASQKLAGQRAQTEWARDRAQKGAVTRSIR
ncbi:M23 family metallopeptidase [Pseudomonas fulva]|uniref:M23 family metallopeptidase n=1 Tax=Pseudomonas fulva TaxID=47880 RepID=UPI00244A0A2C|nr:M23 family metallopeptidase [Pseudomonas fulva]MDH1305321.1 M23 family metallopeptidase [Pseudomonas fulva]